MADFVQTMKDWKRMCDTYDYCSDCPLNDDRETCIHASRGKWPNSVDNLERRVMAWAAEHPEPVYPTWLEWLKSMGVIPYLMGLVTVRDVDGTFEDGHVNITENAFKEIPADIAEKLGLQPKEGTC